MEVDTSGQTGLPLPTDSDHELDLLADTVDTDTEDETLHAAGLGHGDDDDMSDVASTSSSDEGSYGQDGLQGQQRQWLDSERLSAEPRPESVTSAEESENFELNIDPEGIVSLHPELEAAAQRKVALIKARYEEAVVKPQALRSQQERSEAVARGEMMAEMAAHEDELAIMGLDPEEVRDTSMVAEYAADIFSYMSRCEKETMANPNYMDFQNEIQW